MISENEIEEVKKITEELLFKMEAGYSNSFIARRSDVIEESKKVDVVLIGATIKEPHMFIGQGGQNLLSLQRIISIIASRRLKKNLFIQLDINDYIKEKESYLKEIAREAADGVSKTKIPKVFPPMPPHERKIIHSEISQRSDVSTQSRGEGNERYIMIIPK